MNFFQKGKPGALIRYRIMANFSGVMSLLLWFIYLPIKIGATDGKVSTLIWSIAAIHGYSYILYIITAFQYCISVRKSLGVMVLYLLAGTLPIASFIADRQVVKHSKNSATA